MCNEAQCIHVVETRLAKQLWAVNEAVIYGGSVIQDYSCTTRNYGEVSQVARNVNISGLPVLPVEVQVIH